ncbi:MAG: orotidine-5'-phosphate decarboxylase [Candidatus Hermodarchaeia archaeon]|jgi:orotidine 5'-phosphate decarboxylase subfamily 1/orotate phosphoribosyltransferase
MMKLFGQAFIKKMNARVDTHKTRVIHALDVANTFTPDAPESARKELIERACHIATAVEPHVVAIKLNYPLVLAVGLEIVQYLKKLHPDLPLIADFKVADIDNTNAWIARHTYSAGIDAIIVQGFIGEDAIQGVIQEAKKAGDQGIILVVDMSHPGAAQFIHPQTPRLINLAKKLKVSGVIAPGTRPSQVQEIRNLLGTETLILAPGVGAQGGKAGSAISAGADYEIIGRSIYTADNPALKAKEFAELTYNAQPPADVSPQEAFSNTLATLLTNVGAIKFGEFKLASGKTSPYYIDLRVIPSFPREFQMLTDLFTQWLAGHPDITFDRIAGVPTAGISFATALCNRLSTPLLYIRSKPKKYGRQKRVEGVFEPGDHVLVIDDLITDGGSKIEAVQALRDADLKVTDVLVAVDREQGGPKQLKDAKLTLHALAPISHLIKSLETEKHLSKSDAERILAYIANLC